MIELTKLLGESRSFYGFESDSTIASLMIKIMPTARVEFKPLQGCSFTNDKNIFTAILQTIAEGLNKVYGFNINVSVSYDVNDSNYHAHLQNLENSIIGYPLHT